MISALQLTFHLGEKSFEPSEWTEAAGLRSASDGLRRNSKGPFVRFPRCLSANDDVTVRTNCRPIAIEIH